jgi:hypothetical protein
MKKKLPSFYFAKDVSTAPRLLSITTLSPMTKITKKLIMPSVIMVSFCMLVFSMLSVILSSVVGPNAIIMGVTKAQAGQIGWYLCEI